jgi:hypothetical protein
MRKCFLIFCWLTLFTLPLSFPTIAGTKKGSVAYAVQVSACLHKASAVVVVEELEKEGYAPSVAEIKDSRGRIWHVVRIGDYANLKDAETAARLFVQKEGREAVVTPESSMRVLRDLRVESVKVAMNESKPVTASSPEKAAAVVTGSDTVSEAETAKETLQEPVLKPAQEKTPETTKAEPPEPVAKEVPPTQPSNEKASAPTEPPATVAQNEAPGPAGQQENVQKTPEKEKPPTSAVSPPSSKQLEDRIKTIEKELKQLREEREARKKLEVTAEEKKATEKEILSAAGREYVLLKKNTLGVEYNFSYAYYSYDVLREVTSIEHHSNHNLTNALYLEYALFNNLTFNTNLPFVYKYDRSGTSEAKDVNDLGDVSAGVQWQPFKSSGTLPSFIFQGTFTLPSGRSPYKINPDTELDTGLGYYSAGAGVTLSHTIDPIVAFGSLSYNYNFDVGSLDQNYSGGRVLTAVDPGDTITLGLGIGYALSYKVSLNISYQYAYHFATKYHWGNAGTTNSAAYASSIFSVGTGWRISPKRSIYLKVGIGLTNDDPDFLFSIRVPFQFEL